MKNFKILFYLTIVFCFISNNAFTQDTIYQTILVSPADDLTSSDFKVYLADGAFMEASNQVQSGAIGHYYSEDAYGVLLKSDSLSGTLLFATTGSELFVRTEDINTLSEDLKFSGYFKVLANPTTHFLQGEYELEDSGDVGFRIFNTLGIEVISSSPMEQQSQGKHQFEFDVQSLSTGTYFLVFYFENKIHAEKFVKIQK